MTKADKIAEQILLGTKYHSQKLVLVYLKQEKIIVSSNGTSEAEKAIMTEWLKNRINSEMADGAYKVNLNSRIFVFNKWEDSAGIVLSGELLPKTQDIRIKLLDWQTNYLTGMLSA